MRTLSLLMASFLCAPVSAFNLNADEQLETIVVTLTRAPQELSEVNRAMGVIDEASLKLNNHVHIEQALNQIPGVYFHRNSGQEYLAAIRSPVLTGAGACGEFLILENGIPVRPAGMCNVNELFETHHQLAHKIEILKGPATSVYGSNGLHGVVNIITPQFSDGAGETRLTWGEDDYIKLNQLNQFGNWHTALSIIDDGGFRDSSGVEQQVLSLRHERPTDKYLATSHATLFNLDQQTAGYLVGENAYQDKSLIATNPNPEAYRKGKGFRIQQHYQFTDGVTISPYLRHSDMEFIQHFLPGQAIEENGQTSIGVQSSKRQSFANGVVINYGADAEFARLSLLEYQPQPTSGSAFLQATIPAGKHYDYDVESLALASFFNTNWQVSDDTVLQMGLRAEYLRFDYNNLMLTGRTDEAGEPCGFGGCRFSRPGDRTDEYFQWSPQVGVTYAASENSQMYLSFIHGFRAPQATELYRLQREQTVADLKPVELSGFDAGWRYTNQHFSVDLSFYDYDKSNAIVRNTDFFNVSGAKTEHQGIELATEYRVSQHYTVGFNSTFSKHRYLNNPDISETDIVGLDIDTSPRELANLSLNYQGDKLSWRLHSQYISDYYTDVENQHRYSGHLLTHFNARYQLNDTLELGAKMTNLTNESYASRADYSGFSGERYFPGKPRHFSLSISYKY